MSADYSMYYTPMIIADALVGLLEFPDNAKVIDICCGSCNLLRAAKKVNEKVECTAVDVNFIQSSEFDIIQCDGREFAKKHEETYEIALANPPFGKVEDGGFSDVLFVGDYLKLNSSRMEVQMIVANLHMLKKGGVLLAIVPSTIVDGFSTNNVRKYLASANYIKAIIDMPYNSFHPKRIKCSAVIIVKCKNEKMLPTQVYSMSDTFAVHEMCSLEAQNVKKGKWTIKGESCTCSFLIKQGKIQTNEFTNDGTEVLHTAKASENWMPCVRHSAHSISETNLVRVDKGDIIISRVGASAGQKMEYCGDSKLISDCLFVVKGLNSITKERLLQLELNRIVKGLATPYITAEDIYALYAAEYGEVGAKKIT